MKAEATPPGPSDDIIEYAPRPNAGRKIVRRVAYGLATLVALIGASMFAPRLRTNIQLWNLQRQCLRANPSADTIVYDDNSDSRARLLAVDPQYMTDRAKASTMWFCKPWEEFYAKLSPPGHRPMATLFIGELRSASGTSRLVVVEASGLSGSNGLFLQATVIEPGSVMRPPVILCTAMTTETFREPCHVFSGRLDKGEPSAVLVRCDSLQRRYEIRVTLKDQGKCARIESQRFPLTTPAPSSPAKPPTSD